MNNGHDVEIDGQELALLSNYRWPGNVRELKNILERSLILQRGGELKPSELIAGGHGLSMPVQAAPLPGASVSPLAEVERNHISQSLARLSGNITQTSKALGISVSILKRKLKEYGLR